MLTLEQCSADDELVHFYTGLESYHKFKFVPSTLGPAAYCLKYMYGRVANLTCLSSVDDQFFVVLIAL